METKEDSIKSVFRLLMRIMNKQRRLEEISVRLGLFSHSQAATALVLLDVIEEVIDERLERR